MPRTHLQPAETAQPQEPTEILVLLDLEFGIDDVEATDDLIASGRLDSLGLFELILCLEETFDIAIDQEQLSTENFATVDAMAELIGALRS